MGVSLYTSRIVLNTLGVVDFGIYNVVGGVVVMFSFLNSSMSSATQRFLSFELGKSNSEKLSKVFRMSVNIHAIIAVAIFTLAETAGLWFLNTKLNIPGDRMEAANCVYQFSILSFIVTVISVPYNAMIIAHERMKIYAYISILEVILKLSIVFVLVWFGYDKLKMYAIFVFLVSLIIWVFYSSYCKRNFKESNFRFYWEHGLYKTMMTYAGWNLFGNLAGVAIGQGINLLLNIFFGPVINAARGIAFQVNGAINAFVVNFQMAINPQIIKSYASDKKKHMQQLIVYGSKYSYFLLFFITLPIILEADFILKLWLKIVPDYTVLFCRLVLVNSLIDCISGSLMTAAQATGKIVKYQSVVGGVLFLILPISYILLKIGLPPQVTLYVSITISILALFSRLVIISPLVNLSISTFLRLVLIKILLISGLSVIFPLIIKFLIAKELIQFFAVSICSSISVAISVYFIGLKKEEKVYFNNFGRQIMLSNKTNLIDLNF
jgi:O-antigen/teichoic acid export membrane protein